MSQCYIYFPGLLGPNAPIEVLAQQEWPGKQDLPHLTTLLARGKTTLLLSTDIETRLLNCLGISFSSKSDAPENERSVDKNEVPIAQLRAQKMPELVTAKRLWCLDPVYVQIDKEDAVLQANDQLELGEEEAQRLIEDINVHFEQDSIKLHYCSRHQWVLEADFELSTTSLSSVLFNPISTYQPTGPDEKQWRNLINEVQMLLYRHPLNQAREEQGVMPVNSLWLWGGGRSFYYKNKIDCVFSDDGWVADIASACDITHQAVKQLEAGILGQPLVLVVCLDQLAGVKRNDMFAWLDSLYRLENEILKVLMVLVLENKLDSITIISDTISIQVTKKTLTRWWRRVKPMRNSVLVLRDSYGL